MLKHHSNPRLVAALCALSLSACGPAPTANPSVNPSSIPSTNPSENPSALASATVPGVTTALTVHLQADASLAGFATAQQGPFSLCLGQIASAETHLNTNGNAPTRGSERRSLMLKDLLAGVDFTLNNVAPGSVEGRTTFFNAAGQELGFVSWQANVTTGTRVSILLKSGPETRASDICPRLDTSVSGGTILGAGGQVVNPQPLPNPVSTPVSNPGPSPSPVQSPGPAPGVPLNVEVVEQTSSSLTLQWEFPADARSFRLYLDGVIAVSDYVTPNYYRFEGLRENTTYRLGVQSVNAAGASEIVTLSSATINGHSGSGNFSGGGSSRGRASASPEPLGEFRVPDFTTHYQGSAGVAMDADGDFVVIWTDYTSGDGDIYARRYAADGSPDGSSFRVNTYTTGHQFLGSVARDNDGNFVIAWTDYSLDGSGYGIYARRYDPSGPLDASEFLVNTYTTNNQIQPDVALNNAGEFIITWTDLTQDGSNNGIYAR
ncbi:MAG TPA: fibronectin type III domain-containing protein, partial [Candidatus Obscuribacterales bacterium]